MEEPPFEVVVQIEAVNVSGLADVARIAVLAVNKCGIAERDMPYSAVIPADWAGVGAYHDCALLFHSSIASVWLMHSLVRAPHSVQPAMK